MRIKGCSTACLVLDPTFLVLFAFVNVTRYCGFFAVSIILIFLVIMFKTGIIGYCKYLKNKHWMQFMELSAIEANGI